MVKMENTRHCLLRIGLMMAISVLSLYQSKGISQVRCLIVLDIQQFSPNGKPGEEAVQEMIRQANGLIDYFKPENIIYVKSAELALEISLKGFSIDTLPAREFNSALHVVNNNLITKVQGDAFTSEELNRWLETKHTKEIVLTGLLAEECIYHTALGGKNKGYTILIPTEAVVGKTAKKKNKALNKMQELGITTYPVSEFLKYPTVQSKL